MTVRAGGRRRAGLRLRALWPALAEQAAPGSAGGAADAHARCDARRALAAPAAAVAVAAGAGARRRVAAEVQALRESVEFDWVRETARRIGIVAHRLLRRIGDDGLARWTRRSRPGRTSPAPARARGARFHRRGGRPSGRTGARRGADNAHRRARPLVVRPGARRCAQRMGVDAVARWRVRSRRARSDLRRCRRDALDRRLQAVATRRRRQRRPSSTTSASATARSSRLTPQRCARSMRDRSGWDCTFRCSRAGASGRHRTRVAERA